MGGPCDQCFQKVRALESYEISAEKQRCLVPTPYLMNEILEEEDDAFLSSSPSDSYVC